MEGACPLGNPSALGPEGRYAVVFLVVNAVVCALILAGNALTLCALLHQRWYRKETLCPRFKVSSLFVMNLTVADFLIGCSILFFLIAHYVCSLSQIITHNEFLCLLKTAVFVFAGSISVASIASISIDRYVAVVHSLHYPEYMTRRRALGIILCTWVIGSLSGCSLFFWNRYERGRPCLENVMPEQHMTLIGLPLHTVVFLVIVVAHLCIRHEVNALRQRRQQCPASIFGIELQNKSVKSVQALVLVTGCYLVCWLPFLTALSLRVLGVRSPQLNLAFYCLFTLANMNAVLNPFIYSWKNASVRKALQQFLEKLVRLVKGRGRGRGQPPSQACRGKALSSTDSNSRSSSGLTFVSTGSCSSGSSSAMQNHKQHTLDRFTPLPDVI